MNNNIYEDIIKYLLEMRELCIRQTGFEPSIKDYKGHIRSKEFIDKFGNTNISRVFNEILKISGK